MHYFYWDASALAKRFVAEPGSRIVNELLDKVPPVRMLALLIGIGEIVSILVRRRNGGVISSALYAEAVLQLNAEIIQPPGFRLLPVEDDLVDGSLGLIERHSINATDAMILASAIRVAEVLRGQKDELVLVAADDRLLRAAQLEGLKICNPEAMTLAGVNSLI